MCVSPMLAVEGLQLSRSHSRKLIYPEKSFDINQLCEGPT